MHGPVEPKPADVPEDQASVSSEAKTHLKLSSSDEVRFELSTRGGSLLTAMCREY